MPTCIAGGIPACIAAGLWGLGGGRWYPSMPCRFPGPHPVGKLRGLARGDLQAHTPGEPALVGVSALVGCLLPGGGSLQAHTGGLLRRGGLLPCGSAPKGGSAPRLLCLLLGGCGEPGPI